MEKDSFIDTHHPVDKYLTCTAILCNYNHYDFPGLNVGTAELINSEITPKLASESYNEPLLNIGRPIPCLSSKYVEVQGSWYCSCVFS